MKYFFLFLVVLGVIGYTFYYGGDNSTWTDDDLETLVIQKNEDLCTMPELLDQYHITPKQCSAAFVSQIDTCLNKTEKTFPGYEFESKNEFLKAFNETLNCIILSMETSA